MRCEFLITPVFLFNSCKKDTVDNKQKKLSVLIDTDADVDAINKARLFLKQEIAGYLRNNFWDPLAAVISSDQSVVDAIAYPITIITSEGNDNGRTKIDSVSGNIVKVCFYPKMNKFEDLFLDVLNGRINKQ